LAVLTEALAVHWRILAELLYVPWIIIVKAMGIHWILFGETVLLFFTCVFFGEALVVHWRFLRTIGHWIFFAKQ
jgi:hypothetical protein